MSRRRALEILATAGTALATPLESLVASEPPDFRLKKVDKAFLNELERRCGMFFWENSNPDTGLVKDRCRADGPDARRIASIAATGFGLTALCIANYRGYIPAAQVRARVTTTLEFLWKRLTHERGFFFHFVNWRTGAREWNSEVSSIDTAILLCGVLTCRGYFRDRQIRELATRIYERVDWNWMLNGELTFSHGWKPESGFLKNRWDEYCELIMIYLLALGSPTHPVPAETWKSWKRPWFEYDGLRYVNPSAPLFVHQYSQAWFDLRHRSDGLVDYHHNSAIATRAHLRFCLNLRHRFPHFSEDLWGITASDGRDGYFAWGGPPAQGPLDGTVVPCAAAGSLPFCPVECLQTLKFMRLRYGTRVWQRYGFIDAFNPSSGWFAPDVIGIDVGISMIMAENLRSGLIWETFMKNREVTTALQRAGLRVHGR